MYVNYQYWMLSVINPEYIIKKLLSNLIKKSYLEIKRKLIIKYLTHFSIYIFSKILHRIVLAAKRIAHSFYGHAKIQLNISLDSFFFLMNVPLKMNQYFDLALITVSARLKFAHPVAILLEWISYA